MDDKTKLKIRRIAYRISLIVVALCAFGMIVYNRFFVKKGQTKVVNNKKIEMVLSKETTKEIEVGDTINLDFVGYMNGEEIGETNTEGKGYDYKVGSGKILKGIDESLVGHHAGDVYTIETTMAKHLTVPRKYRGKTATIEITIHGVYVEKETEE